MGEHVIRLPDVGEGVAEAELVEWQVKVGDLVREDTILGAVMTDKATVEIPSPVEGEVLWLGAEVGDVIPVGSELVRLKVAGEDSRSATGEAQNVSVAKAPTAKEARYVRSATPRIGDLRAHARAATARPSFTTDKPAQTAPPQQFVRGARRPEGEKPLAAPAVRLRALEAGVDLRQVLGSGPAGQSRTRTWMRTSPTAQILREWLPLRRRPL